MASPKPEEPADTTDTSAQQWDEARYKAALADIDRLEQQVRPHLITLTSFPYHLLSHSLSKVRTNH